MNMTPADQNRTTLLTASKLGARLFRRNVGLAWIGKIVEKSPARLVLENPRPFKSGEIGMSDSSGWVSQIITPDMVGQRIARVVEVEDKQGSGRPSTEQRNWITAVRNAGGYAGISRSPDDTAAIIRGEIRD